MGLLDSLSQPFQGFYNSTVGSVIDSTMDSLGLTRHSRDQTVQHDNMVEQMNWQSGEAQKNRDFSYDMYLKQLENYPTLLKQNSDAQFDLWKKQANSAQDIWNEQFAKNAKYNSPLNQVKMLMQAGINPSSVFGGQGTVAAGGVGQSTPPPTSLGSPTLNPSPLGGHVSPVGLSQGISSSLFSEGASLARDLAVARKAGVETDQLEKLFDYEVEKRTQEIFGMRLTNDSISLQNYVARNIKDVKVRQATQELLKTIADTENIQQDTALKLQEIFTKRAEELLSIAKARLSDKEFDLLKLKVDNFQEEFDTTMKNLRADTARKVSETRLNNALRETENQLRDGKVYAQDLANRHSDIANELLQNDLWISNRTMDAQIDGLIHSWQREGILTKEEAEKLYQLKVSSDWKERQEFINYIGATAQAVGNVLGGAGSALSGASSWKNAQWNNLNYQERNRITRDIGTERNRILDHMSKSRDRERVHMIAGSGEYFGE